MFRCFSSLIRSFQTVFFLLLTVVLHVGLFFFFFSFIFVLLMLSVEGFHLIPVVFLGLGRELEKTKDHDSFSLQITGDRDSPGQDGHSIFQKTQ